MVKLPNMFFKLFEICSYFTYCTFNLIFRREPCGLNSTAVEQKPQKRANSRWIRHRRPTRRLKSHSIDELKLNVFLKADTIRVRVCSLTLSTTAI